MPAVRRSRRVAGGAITPERPAQAKRGRAKQAQRKANLKKEDVGYSKTGKPLNAWQIYIQVNRNPDRPFGEELKRLAVEWKRIKARG